MEGQGVSWEEERGQDLAVGGEGGLGWGLEGQGVCREGERRLEQDLAG